MINQKVIKRRKRTFSSLTCNNKTAIFFKKNMKRIYTVQ